MVIDDFHIVRIAVLPTETDTPLIVDPDAVLAVPIAGEVLQPITGQPRQVTQGGGAVELIELPYGGPGNGLKAPAEPPLEDLLGPSATATQRNGSTILTPAIT